MAERRLNWLTSNKSALEFSDKLRAQMPAGTGVALQLIH